MWIANRLVGIHSFHMKANPVASKTADLIFHRFIPWLAAINLQKGQESWEQAATKSELHYDQNSNIASILPSLWTDASKAVSKLKQQAIGQKAVLSLLQLSKMEIW